MFDDSAGVKNFSNLISDARVDYVIDKANYYGFSGERVKGLIFCSRKDEAKELSRKFNERGLRTEVLTGEDDQARRETVIARLTDDEDVDNQLDYILTVDIFNEGVDIPEINQVIMLRPTQSPVVFIQQLGRGLRKYEGKEYVVILDFHRELYEQLYDPYRFDPATEAITKTRCAVTSGKEPESFREVLRFTLMKFQKRESMPLLIQPEPMI